MARSRKKPQPWTEEEDAFLREWAGLICKAILAMKLNRSEESVLYRLHVLQAPVGYASKKTPFKNRARGAASGWE